MNEFPKLSEQKSSYNHISVVDPVSMRSLGPYPESQSRSRLRRANMRKKFINFLFGSAGCPLLKASPVS
jgi:hypothetical protein